MCDGLVWARGRGLAFLPSCTVFEFSASSFNAVSSTMRLRWTTLPLFAAFGEAIAPHVVQSSAVRMQAWHGCIGIDRRQS